MRDHKSLLEVQFKSLKNAVMGGEEGIFDWLGRLSGDNNAAKAELKRLNFDALATDEGIDFIKSKFPCPNSARRDN